MKYYNIQFYMQFYNILYLSILAELYITYYITN